MQEIACICSAHIYIKCILHLAQTAPAASYMLLFFLVKKKESRSLAFISNSMSQLGYYTHTSLHTNVYWQSYSMLPAAHGCSYHIPNPGTGTHVCEGICILFPPGTYPTQQASKCLVFCHYRPLCSPLHAGLVSAAHCINHSVSWFSDGSMAFKT